MWGPPLFLSNCKIQGLETACASQSRAFFLWGPPKLSTWAWLRYPLDHIVQEQRSQD